MDSAEKRDLITDDVKPTKLCGNTKKIEYQCCLIGILPFAYVSDCIRCGICHI